MIADTAHFINASLLLSLSV